MKTRTRFRCPVSGLKKVIPSGAACLPEGEHDYPDGEHRKYGSGDIDEHAVHVIGRLHDSGCV